MSNRLKLEQLIDLETQLQRDRDEDPRHLRHRDAGIGREINANELAGNELFLLWLSSLKETHQRPDRESAGHHVVQFLSAVGLVLALVGALLGGGAVAGWLRLNPSEPVNAILFWLSLIGLQILLLTGWLLAVIPRRWAGKLPAAGAFQQLLRWIGRVPPLLATWLATRMSEETRQQIREVRGSAARFDWLYGRLRFWILVELTQIFALAYNVGAVVVFVMMTHGNDPAFCWKSTVLDERQVHAATTIVSFPWSRFAENAVLTAEDLEATRFSSFEEQFVNGSAETQQAGWRQWSYFLLASLLTYGLLPRCITLILARCAKQRALTDVRLDHAEFQKLADRLRHPFVATTSQDADADTEEAPDAVPSGPSADAIESAGPVPAVRCDGVHLNEDEISNFIRNRFGKVISTVYDVLGLDEEVDESTLNQLADEPPDEVFVLVEAWEPPVSEYLDLFAKLREFMGARRMINIVLYNRSPDGLSVAPRARDAEMWQRQLATAGDPWLRVETLVEDAPA